MRGWAEADAAGWKEPRDPPSAALIRAQHSDSWEGQPEGRGLPVPRLDHLGGIPPGASTIVCQLKEYPSWFKGRVVETRWGF